MSIETARRVLRIEAQAIQDVMARLDGTFERAVKAGARAQRPVANQFYGDRSGTLEDPFGHFWTIATHFEDVAPEEMKRRVEAAFKSAEASAAS